MLLTKRVLFGLILKARIKMKKLNVLLAIILVLTMLVSLAACGDGGTSTDSSTPEAGGDNDDSSGAPASEPANDGDSYRIVFAHLGTEQEDHAKVIAAINELTLSELNMTFETIAMAFGEYQEKLNLMLAGGDPLDILPVYYTQASSYISAGQIVNLADYIYDYGQDILRLVGEDIATSGAINGFIFGVPSQKESASKAGIVMRADIVEACGIDASTISTYADVTRVFEIVSEQYPTMDMIAGTTFLEKIEVCDPLFDFFGVLMDDGQDTTVVNYFETDWYRSRIEIVSDWYQRGFVKLDSATSTESVANLMKAGNLFSFISAIKPGYEIQAKAQTTYDVATAYIGRDDGTEVNNLWTNAINFFNWGIARNTSDPVKAMQFLNFAYSSPEFNNLMNFGIEGEHYVFVDGSDKVIDYPEGVDDATSTYHLNLGWHLPNQFIGHIWNGLPEDVWDQYMAFNDSATKSKAFGFIYDSSSVSTELTALSNVNTQFRASLETGTAGANWEQTLAEFNDKLYAAGLQTVMDLKQEQLDAWLAEQGN